MSVITYTAKREIEKLAYLKSASNISVDAVDDSFNSSVTNLAGLLTNEWINVSGFANAANNGWFRANANSTANKITQGTTTALVTEAVGPAVVIQGHKRGFGQAYSIEFTPRRLERSSQQVKNEQIAVGGASETLLHGIRVFWDITSSRLLEADMPQWRELLASVAAGENCTFDPYGTIAVPDMPVACKLAKSDFAEQRIGNIRRYLVDLRFRVV